MEKKLTRYKHYLYKTWQDMRQRCYSTKHKQYKDYGGRGIKICDRWLQDFWNFIEDMGHRPKGYSIDRINNEGNYEPLNCRWATHKEQVDNRRPSRSKGYTISTVNGVSYFKVKLIRNGKKYQSCYRVEKDAIEEVRRLKLKYDGGTSGS